MQLPGERPGSSCWENMRGDRARDMEGRRVRFWVLKRGWQGKDSRWVGRVLTGRREREGSGRGWPG